MCCCVPICFFNTKIEILDDDQNWLSAVSLVLNNAHSLKLSSNPDEVIRDIFKNERMIDWVINYDLEEILGNPSRYEIISTVVADFIMPKYDGGHLFNIIGDARIKKIMVSAFMDYDTMYAIKKTYSMDAFLSKNMAMFSNKFSNIINSVKYKFFVSISEFYLNSRPKLKSVLSDTVFYEFFDRIIDEYSISEFYLVDNVGSYILKSTTGEMYEFVLMEEAEIKKKNRLYAEVLTKNLPTNLFMHSLMLTKDDGFTKEEIAEDNSIFFDTSVLKINSKDYYYSFHEGSFFFKKFRV